MGNGRDHVERYYLAWALSEAFGGGGSKRGRRIESEGSVASGGREMNWNEFKTVCKEYKDGGSSGSKSG